MTGSAEAQQNAYNFTFDALMSETPVALSDYAGKVMLVVNTASRCGLTGQYEGLETLYQKYQDKGLVIIGVPSNDFGGQEPGTDTEIAQFCRINYGVSFPMTSKYSVKGSKAHPFYVWAKNTLGFGTAPKWNFHKYVIDRQGMLVEYFHSTTAPDSRRLLKVIEKLLEQS